MYTDLRFLLLKSIHNEMYALKFESLHYLMEFYWKCSIKYLFRNRDFVMEHCL